MKRQTTALFDVGVPLQEAEKNWNSYKSKPDLLA